ncbi:MAG: hypothetical protein KKI02_05550 [Planctomycetes bacterium]|nr:hypothetical protein [Planctomycetota bacterium]
MASIQKTITKATRQLGDLTLSQRLAIALGVLLVVGSVIWLAQWAATPEMAPLLPGQSLAPDDVATVCAGLDAMSEPYRVEGSQVMVRAGANRPAILASLQQAEKLPADTAIGFAQLVQEANPWISQSENDRRWTVALQSELARVLQQFNGVRQARVLLNMSTRKGFARNHPESSAGVTLWMSGGEPVSRSLALAAARMVAGAVRGLPVRNVEVIDGVNNRVALDWDAEETGSASSLHQQRRQLEREKAAQIKELLGFDRNVLVSASVDLDYTTMHVQDSTVSDGVTVKEETDNTNTVRNRRSGQPGVEPNVGMEVSSGTSADSSSTDHSEMTSEPSRRQTTTQTPAGVPKSITAAVSLSYTYLAGIYRHNNPEAEEPAEQDIEQVFGRQRDRIAAHVAKLMIPPDVEQVSVDWHYDTLAPEPAAAGPLDAPLDLLTKYGPASGLGLLALLAMGMTMRLAKRRDVGESLGMEIGMPAEAIEAARQAARDVATVAGQTPVEGSGTAAGAGGRRGAPGRAARSPLPIGQEAESVLDAQEVDESSVQVARMIAQVATMTEQDDEAVAGIIENWITQDK